MRVKHLLKSAAHQHKDPLVRLEHVATLDPTVEESAEMLGQLARTDADLHVRVASIDRLTDLAVLRELLDAQGDDAEAVRDAAERRLGTRIETGDVSDVAIRALLDTHAARLAAGVASVSPHAEQRTIGLNAMDDETALVTVIQQSRLHDARMAAAERLTRHDAIRAALTACRSRDKVVAKLLQQRLDDEAAAEAERIAVRHAVTSTLDSMQQLARSVWSPQHTGKAQALRERWAALEPSDTSSSVAAFASADKAVQSLLDEHQRASAAAEAPVRGAAQVVSNAVETAGSETTGGAAVDDVVTAPAAAMPEPDAESLALAEKLRPIEIALVVAAVDADEGQSDSTLAGALRAHARAVAVLFDPPFDHGRARPASLAARRKRVEALLDTAALVPGLDLSSHAYVIELGAHRDALVDRSGKSEQESADRVKATHRQFAALGGIISEGKWAPANSLLRRLQKKLSAMEPAERKTLDDKLARAEKQLAEMGDWQDFAARPKLDALCVEMEALPAQTLSPPKLAKAVRDLQSQWKELGPSRAANDLWPRFKTAGDTAYEPCKAWFAQKGEERQAKTDARRSICLTLEDDITLLGRAMPVPKPTSMKNGKAVSDDSSSSSDAASDAASESVSSLMPDGTTSESTPSEVAIESPKAVDSASSIDADTSADAAGMPPTTDGAEATETSDAPTDASTGSSTDASTDTSTDTSTNTHADAHEDDSEPDTVGVGPEPDWKAIQRRVGDAKREWSRQRVTDRKPDRKLENRFSAALKPFESALKREYGKNEAAKRELIEKAAALAGGDINQHVANQAKTLLSAWKLVGIMPRRTDQQLWETFNGHLGTIFKHQQTVAREKRRAGFEHVDRARAIAKELRTLARADSVDEAAVQALNDEFNALADFPERDRRGLERDFRAALDATARVQETAGKRRKQAEQEERQRLVELCERLEAAVESPELNPSGSPETLAEDVRHAWEASETRVNREMAVRLEARRDAALTLLSTGGQYDFADNEEARRDLLIRMEVTADIETPPEDKSRRMRFQLENLQAGMTSAAVADRRATLAKLEEDWLAAPPASRGVQGALQSRYLKALGR